MKNATRACLLVLSIPLAVTAGNASAADLGEVSFRQALLDMGTDLRLMCVAAHPDDEDGATLALYRKRFGLKTWAVIATRGEGGQNETGPELYEALGVIRTREMMAAAAVTDAKLRFLNLPEFGYSKSPEETFEIWGREETLRRLVRVIREVRPDVIITHHDTKTGHGHHQALGITLSQAFDAAADPAIFPEQIAAGLTAWQTSRLYVRKWEKTDASVTIDISALDPWSGKTYAQIAADALDRHESQGMGFFVQRYLSGRPKVHYALVKDAPQVHSPAPGAPAPHGALLHGLMDRVTVTDRALSVGTPPRKPGGVGWGRSASAYFAPPAENRPRKELKPILLDYAAELARSRDESPLDRRRWTRAAKAAALAAELHLFAESSDRELVPGQAAVIRPTLIDFGAADAQRATFSVLAASWFPAEVPDSVNVELSVEQDASAELEVRASDTQSPTIPAPDHLFDENFLEPQLDVMAAVTVGATTLELHAPVYVDIAPAITVEPVEPLCLVRQGVDTALHTAFIVTNHGPGKNQGLLRLAASPPLALNRTSVSVTFAAEGEQKILEIHATFEPDIAPGDYHLTAIADPVGATAEVRVRVVDVAVPEGIRVGVVQSYDDTLLNILDRLGIPNAALTLKDFTADGARRFHTIIVDIRAYLVRPDLAANNDVLLDYVEQGGNLVVMYQKIKEWNESFAPYPIHLSRNRTSREDAPIELLTPGHPLFHTPNVIRPEDWDGWIHERGLYFPDKWDDAYTPLIACADPGEQPPPGSCLFTRYGKGTYFYTALSWYRQLRELHPGALRLFANMLALGNTS